MYICGEGHVHGYRYPRRLEASIVSGAEVIGGCELLDGSAGNRMLVLWKPHDGLTFVKYKNKH